MDHRLGLAEPLLYLVLVFLVFSFRGRWGCVRYRVEATFIYEVCRVFISSIRSAVFALFLQLRLCS